MRRLTILLLLLGCVHNCSAQATQTPAQSPAGTPPSDVAPLLLSPQAAYDQASAPVDIVHRDLFNWSEVELASLDVAVAQAEAACVARAKETYAGDDLIAYARLCALGKEWAAVFTAATTYINSQDALKPQLAMAYAFEVQADLNLGHEKEALGGCIAMLQSVPYGPLPDEVTTTTVRFLQFAYTEDAIALLAARQPFLLDLLRAAKPGPATSPSAAAPPQPVSTPAIPLHSVFQHALDFAALEQYVNQLGLASVVVKDIDKAMPADLPPDEAIFIAAERRQYALLGTHFPELPGAVSLQPATETPLRQPNFGSVNFFLLFPPWCAQCIRQTHDLLPALARMALLRGPEDPVYIYALLADKIPPATHAPAKSAPSPKPAAQSANGKSAAGQTANKAAAHATDPAEKPEQPPSAEDQLRKTPTLVVDPSTLADFNASDFPFLIATDHNGIIRLMVPGAPQNALVQGGPIEQVADTIGEHWRAHMPPPPPAPPSPPRPAPPAQ